MNANSTMKLKKKKKKKKVNKVSIWATIVSIVAVMGLLGVVMGLVIVIALLQSKPTLNLSDFDSPESSVVYDVEGNAIADLGATIRENVTYDQLPNVVVDAFVAVEDSRFFEHNGFDIPRFVKAMLENVKTMSFSQGGSTFTMQLCKNTYFTNDETGETASRSGASGIKRKVQEIALAIELEGIKSKKSILTDYINKLNFGGSGNIRGIQKAAQYYFQKDVEELNISEAALLAGVINAPVYYNPFNNLEAATERRNEVLYLMNYHGYISDLEYEIAKSIKVEDLLMDPYSASGDATPYQAYIDAVVEEVYDLTGLSPYSTTMHIYTYMEPEIQTLMDNIQAGDVDDYFEYPDEWFELASVCIDNDTGQIVGILGGRNYAEGGALLLNHAVDQYKQPGSTIKPIIDYSLAFENLGWATSHVLTDKPIFYGHEDIVVENFSGGYVGDVTLKTAVGDSINTCAIQTLQAVIESKGKTGEEYVVDYMQSLGYEVDLDTFDIQFAIGGAELTVTCEQMAGAYAMIMNGGRYIEPHCVSRIEFTNGKSPIEPTYESTQVLSEQAAYLTSTLLKSNVDNFYGSYSYLKDDYPIYAKTGTTDWSTLGVEYGIPVGANKDAWIVGCTSNYSIATWTGYEKATTEHVCWISDDEYYNVRIQARVTNLLLDKTVEIDGTPSEISKPEGISSITHILGTYPYASIIDGMDEKYIANGLVKSGATSLVSPTPASVNDLNDDKTKTSIVASSTDDTITFTWEKYSDESKLKVADETYDYELLKGGEVVRTATLKRLFDYSWIYGPIQYKADVTITHKDQTTSTFTVASSNEEYTYDYTILPGDKISAKMYYGYEKTAVNSNSVTRSYDVSSSISCVVPSNITSEDDLKTWAKTEGITLSSIEKIETTDTNLVGTVVIKKGNSTYKSTQTLTGDASDKFTATFYVKNTNVTISIGHGDLNKNSITFTASVQNSSDNVSWTIPKIGKASGNSITINASDLGDGEHEIKASVKGASTSVTIKISDGKVVSCE